MADLNPGQCADLGIGSVEITNNSEKDAAVHLNFGGGGIDLRANLPKGQKMSVVVTKAQDWKLCNDGPGVLTYKVD